MTTPPWCREKVMDIISPRIFLFCSCNNNTCIIVYSPGSSGLIHGVGYPSYVIPHPKGVVDGL